ncbi:WbqC family protein [Actinoallomurus liliacearum]|uniref:WbqC family protein n=1 Tax=Actinoallomurus liliacearum TaxID=1080073 RepID=UPI0031E4F80A
MKRVAIVQSNYIPWKGYFDLIAAVDEFILLDNVQFTTRDWRNRNRIKTASGVRWLSIPVIRGARNRPINEVESGDPDWRLEHWRILTEAYRRAPHWADAAPILERLYQGCESTRLSTINRHFLEGVCDILRIRAEFSRAEDYDPTGTKTERLVDLCVKAGADEYVTGPAARAYLDESLFHDAGIDVRWFDYSGYPEYPQVHPPFDHQVSILDLIVNTGPAAARYLKFAAPASTRS